MLAGLIATVVGTEIAQAKRRMRRRARRAVILLGLWSFVALLILIALLCFIFAGHLALALYLHPIAAWALTGAGVLLLACCAALVVIGIASMNKPRF